MASGKPDLMEEPDPVGREGHREEAPVLCWAV